MSQMYYSKGGDNSKTNPMRPLRAVRQSEPSLMVQDIINDVTRIKEEHQLRRMKKQRQVRHSEIETNATTISKLPTFVSPQSPRAHHCFLSPPSGPTGRVLKKNGSSTLLSSEFVSPRNFTKKSNQALELKTGKSPGKGHRQSLNMIEQMLLNHGVSLQSTKKVELNPEPKRNGPRSPRYSEPVMQQFPKNRKQNQSYGNTKEKAKESSEAYYSRTAELKETMSTSSSYKNMKVFKISDFQLGKQLGKGKFGRVKLARHRKTGAIFSLKIISKNTIRQENLVEQVVKEVKIQSFLDHSHIIKLYSVFDDRDNIYLLLELCSGGNLYQYMQQKLKIQEEEASLILKSVCEAVGELHHHQIVHRDIKPENIVLCYGMAKICDFGWSTEIKEEMRQTFCGTPLYVSPELLSGKLYDEKVDQWAIGILGFEMMTGNIPFSIKSERDLVKIIETKIVFPKWMGASAVSFLKELLAKDPEHRKGIEDIIDHPFVNPKKSNALL